MFAGYPQGSTTSRVSAVLFTKRCAKERAERSKTSLIPLEPSPEENTPFCPSKVGQEAPLARESSNGWKMPSLDAKFERQSGQNRPESCERRTGVRRSARMNDKTPHAPRPPRSRRNSHPPRGRGGVRGAQPVAPRRQQMVR